jgi:hypothetical protein
VDVEDSSHVKHASPVQRMFYSVHQQRVADTAIFRIASIEEDLDYVHSVSSGMDVIHHHEVCYEPVLGIVQFPCSST